MAAEIGRGSACIAWTRLRRALLAGLAPITLAACGGGDFDDAADGIAAVFCDPPPSITSNPPTTATVGTEYRYQASAFSGCGIPFVPLACVAGTGPLRLPAGAQFLDSGDLISWTPAPSQANTSVRFAIATEPDACGRQATQSWTVHVAPDTTRPTVASTWPLIGGTFVAINTTVTAVFSEDMDGASITSLTVRLQDSFGNLVAAVISSSGRNATLDPIAALTPSTAYTAVITPGVRDISGNALAAANAWTFTTGAN